MSPVTVSTPLGLAIWSLRLQAVGLVGIAGWLIWLTLTRDQASSGAGIAESVVAAGVGVLIALAAINMRRGRSGMRGVAIFIELMYFPAGYYLAQAGLWWFAVAAWILGVGTIVLLMTSSAREDMGIE